AFPANSSDSTSEIFTGWGPRTILGSQYYYRGPYRLVNNFDWQFKFYELDGRKRLFREGSWVAYDPIAHGPLSDDNQVTPNQYRLYYNSYLFPLATKIDLTANVTHLSSVEVDGVRSENNLPVAGKTDWMDGSDAGAQSRNHDLEHIA